MKSSFKVESKYLEVICEGKWLPEHVTDMLMSTRLKAMETSRDRILLNWAQVSAPHAEFDRYLAGKDIATLCPPPLRVGVHYPAEMINKFAEDTAVNRGAGFFVCGDRAEALAWLLDGDA